LFDNRKLIAGSGLFAKVFFAACVFLCAAGNALADLQITKTIDGSPSPAAENAVVRYNLSVTNTGPGNLNNVIIDDVPANLSLLNFTVTSANPPPNSSGPGANQYQFNNLAAGEIVTLNLDATVTAAEACPIIENTASVSSGGFLDSATAPDIEYNFQLTSGSSSNVISHVVTSSFCELCTTGEVHIRITNPTTTTLQNITVVENLQALGLSYIAGSTTLNGVPISDPAITGIGTILTWVPSQIGNLGALGVHNIRFRVSTYSEASLLTNPNRNIIASASFNTPCTGVQTVNTGLFELPLREPLPEITKLGRNVDGGQNSGNYTPIVFGQEFDDIIWRVDVENNGLAGLQDLLIADTVGGNFVVNYICPTEAAAEAIAVTNNGVDPGSVCVPMTSSFAVDDPFGNPAGDQPGAFVDTPAGGNAFVYYVGRINASCAAGEFNTVDMQWGCEATSPPEGGVTTTSTGLNPAASSAELSTDNGAALTIDRVMRGIDGGAEIGSNGEVVITITNNTGGTVRDIVLDNLLPVEYVRDTSFAPVLNVTPLHDVYDGMIDILTDTNVDAVTLLNNTQPVFALTSTTARNEPASTNDNHMLRAGDVAIITFRIVLIDRPHFDIVADLDVIEEDPLSTPANTDPTNAFAVRNILTVNYLDTCTFTPVTPLIFDEPFQADVEDFDVTTSAPLYILTNDPAFPVPLTIVLTNNGGHDASNYYTYVSFGETIDVQTPPPAGCTLTSNPPPRAVWLSPAPIPATAAVYECTDNNPGLGTINAGQTINLTFDVIKDTSPAAILADDLTFRADVVGVIELFDGTELIVPPPDTATINNTTNNYTLDAIRTRVLGFNLTKAVSGLCSEDANVPVSGDSNLIIGEDCTYRINAGGWFGFLTPGFTLIEVRDVVVTDDLDDGLGYISHDFTGTDFLAAGGVITSPIVINSPPSSIPLSEEDITWAFNPLGSGITVKDQFFRVDITTRLLNDPVDLSAAPNVHAANTFDIGKASFTAVFDTAIFNVDETQSIPGYPDESVRRVDLSVTEPNITVVKEVCNETLNGIGINCNGGVFTTSVNDGDTNDSYIYRITLTNEASSAGVPRAPAYNVIATDTLDISDLMLIDDFASDGLDNDGDGLIDGADGNGEGTISENVANGITPAIITVSNTHSLPLQLIDPGDSVTFYYRVDPDDAIAPLQALTNTVVMQYDSLAGDSGNQFAEPRLNSDPGGARVYNTTVAQANVQMIPLVAQPKAIITVSNSTLGGATQAVVIGEEIRYQLTTQLPVANLRQFVIRDRLPAGIRCVENGPVVDMSSTGPHAAAGFNPGTPVTPVCSPSGDEIVWDFGDRELTLSAGITRFDFVIDFVARVENVAANQEALVLTNGGGTDVTARYVNEADTTVTLNFAPVDVVVREPVIALTKAFAVANSDAADVLTVTVTATNNGTTAAYNLRVLDDLVGSDMTFIPGSLGGTDPPDNADLVTLGANQPIFSWNPASPDYEILMGAGNAKSFTFNVRVDTSAQPLEILDNTIQAKWDSLPGQTTALNASGSIGANGSELGLRHGVLPNSNPADTLNDYEITASDSISVLPLTLSKNDLNPTLIAAIGAHKNFEVVINLPEGTTNNLVLGDNLNFSGLSYALSRNASFDVSFVFNDIVSINGQPPAEAVFTGSGLGTLPVDNDSGIIEWNIGTVVTAEENDPALSAVNPSITIRYFARVNNDVNTDDTDTLQNSATVTYNHGETAATETLNDDTPVQIVVEPLLVLNPAITITNQTVGKLPGDLPDAGDILEYQITLENTGTATAFDVNLSSTLPPQLLFDTSLPVPTATIGGVAVSGFETTPAASPAGPLVWGRGNADNTLDIPVGQSLVLTYRSVVQTPTQPNTVMDTSITVDWTSLDNADASNAFERDGGTCPVASDPDDYCLGPQLASITAIDSNALVKSIIFDTYDIAPLSTNNDSIARVGDTVSYRLQVILQEGLTRNVVISDTLPAGLTFVDIVSINTDITADYDPPLVGDPGSNFSYATLLATNVPAAGTTGTLNWNFGDITNDDAGDASTDTIVIEYRARVTENAGIVHQPTFNMPNTGDLNYIDVNAVAAPDIPRLNSIANLTVLQPLMDALTKTDRDGSHVSGDPVNVATDIMNFRLHSCNTTGLAPAYGVLITDNLPTQLNESTIIGPTNGALTPDVRINGVLLTEGAANDYIYTPPAVRGGDMVFRFNTAIDPAACVDIDFDIGFYTDFGFGNFSNQFDLNEYYSLPPANAQLYPALAATAFDMNNPVSTIAPPTKVKFSADEATIGDEVVYRITVPGVATGTIMYDVTITDNMDASLVFVSAVDTNAVPFTVTSTTAPGFPNQVNMVIGQIPAGQQAVIELRARVSNNIDANAGVIFNNAASFTYADAPDGTANNVIGSGNTVNALNIIEPAVAVAKTVENITSSGFAPDAGDILRYTITLTASGGATAPTDFFSDAFDVSLDDSLSLGLLYIIDTFNVDGGNFISNPIMVGDGIATPQSLSWNLAAGNADIDITEGTIVTVTYDVLVLDSVLADQNLSNSIDIQWSSRDGPDANERNGSGVPPLNDYFNLVSAVTLQTTPDNNVISKTRLTDTFNPADNIVRIGDIVDYELHITMQEGTSANFVIQDTLAEGLIFEQTLSINGETIAPYPAVSPFSHTAIPAAVVVGDPVTGPTTVTWNAGNVINAGDNNPNDDFVITYRARVLNLALPQINNTSLTNTVNVDYAMASGAAPTKTDNQLLDLQQPNLSITKVQVFNPTSTDSVIDAGEVVRYQISITNNGSATAYDTELIDTIPAGLRSPAITMISMVLTSAAPLPPLPLPPVYDPVTGTATWNFDTGTADQYNIATGDTLQLVYEVQADVGLGAGITLSNRAQIQFYYSFDNNAVPIAGVVTGVREIYQPIDFAEVVLTTTPANALLKANPTDLDVSIGETFIYTLTVPEIPQATALYDVHILDDLNLSAADLLFVEVTKISGSQIWTPVNTGTVADNLIIADITNGIDIPANEQVVIELTVTLRNTNPPNVAGLLFTNEATYTFNQINGDNATRSNGLGSITADMTVVEPDLTLDKRGPAGTVNFATPIPYTLVVENIGTGPAFDTTIVDQLPDAPDNSPLTGGTCDVVPVNFDLRITSTADETTVLRALVLDTDYTVTYTAAPTCELVITTLTDSARIEVGEKLMASYDVSLDPASQSGAALTNIAGVTQWFSLDTAGAGATGEIREYNRTITDGTTATIDHEAAFTVIVEAPVLDVQKTVENVTTVQSPGSDASPSDVLRYTITVSNAGIIDAAAVTVSDVIPANATYVANSVLLNGIAVADLTPGVSPLIIGIDISSSDLTPPLPAAGNGIITVGENATISFDVLLLPVITSGTVILNQALVNSPSTGVLPSDDPNINGIDDPLVIGDEDETATLITSAPAFQIDKTSQDISGDLTVLEAGDSLRYTLLVKNIGQENAVNVLLSDQIPANTSYVANTTTLNGVAVADPSAGISALAAGFLIHAPENSTAGFLRADTSPTANNVASISFDVMISNSVIDGTVISNQGFLSGDGLGSGMFPQQPSDDPVTPLPADPTLDIVGNVPVVDVLKTVVIQTDLGTIGIVDPGDVLRYTITASNIGAIPASNVVLTDAVPANTSYVPNTTRLNGLAVSDSGVNTSSLIAGIAISSNDLSPPTGLGSLTAQRSAIVTFDLLVNAGTLPGTIISNQAFVSSNEVPTEPSDADGIDANGDQPTVVVVGNVQQLAISKQVLVVGGGVAQAGGELEYVVRVSNIGSIAASNVIITDNLDLPIAGQMTYVAGSALLNGLPAGVSIPGSIITADYATTYGDLAAAGIAELRFRVLLDSALNIGETISNTGEVSWNLPAETVSATVDIDIGGTPGSANLNGVVWHDTDFDNVFGAGESLLQDWTVELYRNNSRLANTLSDINGVFQFSGLPPNLPLGDAYELRYVMPGAIATSASLGTTSSVFTNGAQRITDILAASGSSLQNLNLPRQPNGVVYDSVLRVPVAGVRLTMVNQTRSNQVVPESCFNDANHQNQVTLAEGFYKFDLNFSDPLRCAEGNEYEIQVLPPGSDFVGTTSVIIPPLVPVTANAFDVPNCPGSATDQIPATTLHCENSVSAVPAAPSIAPRTSGTNYHLKFLFNNVPETDQIFNNHIAVDPKLDAAVAISKVAGMVNVTRSQLVPYTITINNVLGVPLQDLNVVDNFPAGFKYVSGSARLDGVEAEPLINNSQNSRQLTWENLSLAVAQTRVIKLLLVVGSGVGEGEYINTARMINALTGEAASGVASATVRVIPDPTFDCTDIIGKVFDDANNNTYQDKGEKGLVGVQVATARGLRVTTDKHGRFHITCAIVPNEVRGSNFIMKVDDRTLPSGYRITTENPRVQRATRGKMLKFNFGASIHRVVRLDLANGVFEKGSSELRPQWRSRIELLLIELEKAPSILRLSYLGENETEKEVENRLDAIDDLISKRWQEIDCCYKLEIEKEVFWRKGKPSDRKRFK